MSRESKLEAAKKTRFRGRNLFPLTGAAPLESSLLLGYVTLGDIQEMSQKVGACIGFCVLHRLDFNQQAITSILGR